MRMAAAGVLGFLATAALASQGGAPVFNARQPPLLLRLRGTIAADAAAVKADGFMVTSLELLGEKRKTVRYVGVTSAVTHGGDNPVLGKDVLEAVRPFDPNFLVVGPRRLLERLVAAPSGSRIEIDGLVDRASRRYYLKSVDASATG